MLVVNDVSKAFGDLTVLEQVTFTVNRGDRLGLVGPNGCGKTTLLRIMAGLLPPDRGSVAPVPSSTRVGYLPQALTPPENATVEDVLLSLTDREPPPEVRLERVAAAMANASGEELDRLMATYDRILAELSAAGGYDRGARLKAVMAEFGLADVDLATPFEHLSGGQKTRLGLARLIMAGADLLLLDEPTNHLDIDMLQWLESYLVRFDGALVIVSHDRFFLDRVVTGILELDSDTHQVKAYPGTYSDYVEAKAREREKQWEAYRDQQERIARMEADIRTLKQRSTRIENETIHFHYRRIAKEIARTAVVRERRLRRLLDSEERIEKPQRHWTMKLDFGDPIPSGQDVLRLEGTDVGFPGRRLISNIDAIVRHGERIALMGPNGTGKTTLLKVIAGELPPLSGQVRLGTRVRIGYYAQEQEGLDPRSNAYETIRSLAPMSETDVRSFLHYFLFAGDQVFQPIASLSYGERARLALARLVAMGCNLLLLDEPLNHLDVPSRTAFEQALESYEGTVIAVAHDRYFVSRFADKVWLLEGGRLSEVLDPQDAWRGHGPEGEGR